jgi:DNA-binding FrmR family transcriptional regulator
MAHTILHKKRLLHRVQRIRGQIAAVERALVEERGSREVMLMLSASRGAIHALMVELLTEHLRAHVVEQSSETTRRVGADAVAETFRRALR